MSRRGLAWAAGIVVIVIVAAAVGVLASWAEIVRWVAVRQIAAATGRTVTLAGAELDLYRGRLALHGLEVTDHDQHPLVTVERLEARFGPRELLRGHLRITAASLQNPAVRLVRTGSREFNVSDLVAGEGRKGEGSGLAVTIEQLVLFGGTVEVEDRTLAPAQHWRVESLAVQVQEVTSLTAEPAGVVTVHAVAAGAPLSLWITGVALNPLRFQATIIAREMQSSVAALYLPPASPLSPVRGTLDATAIVVHDGPKGTDLALDLSFVNVVLRGRGEDAEVAGMPAGREQRGSGEITEARRERRSRALAPAARVSAPAVRVRVDELRFGPGVIDLGRLQVEAERVRLSDARLGPVRRWEARDFVLEAHSLSSARDAAGGVATARAIVAGSPVSVFAADLRLAPVELHATAIVRNVDATLLALYLPEAASAWSERGVLDATVRVDHDADRGTRLALDATVRDLALRQARLRVTGPALRVTAEDVLLGPGAVTVGRATLGGAQLTLADEGVRPVRTWAVEGLAVEARDLSSRPGDVQGVATVQATVAGAPTSVWLTRLRLAPLELHATAILRAFDLTLLGSHLPPDVPIEPTRGLADASIEIEHTEAGGTRVQGDARLTRLEARGPGPSPLLLAAPSLRVTLSDARRHGDALSAREFELTGSGSVVVPRPASARFEFDHLRVQVGGIAWPGRGPARVEAVARLRDGAEVEITGMAELTAAAPEVAWTADVDAKFTRADLALLAPHVPAVAGLTGRATATVKATVTSAGSLTARIRGDGTVASLALADGGRVPVQARQVEVSGLDVAWPERVTLGRVRLVEPRAVVERDRTGTFPLLARVPAAAQADRPPSTDAGGVATGAPAIAVGEVVIERGSVVFVDEHPRRPVRVEVPALEATVHDVAWPGPAVARLTVQALLPGRGTLGVTGAITTNPAQVDVQLTLANGSLALAQPYLDYPARVDGRLDADLRVSGPLEPAPLLTVRGGVVLQALRISDEARPVVTADRLELRGIDGTWPARLVIDEAHVRGTWALLERDGTGAFNLRPLFARPAAPTPAAGRVSGPGPAGPASAFEFRLREGILEDQGATIVDGTTTPTARFDIAGARLTVHDLAWPPGTPAKIRMTSPMPGGGRLAVDGTVALEPMRLDARASLDRVALAPGQPYLPIEGQVSGQATGELAVELTLDPLGLRVNGDAHVEAFRLNDGDRPLVTMRRLDARGIHVDWPGRVTVDRVELQRPRLLIERDPNGEILLQRLVTPRAVDGSPGPSPGAPGSSVEATTVEIGMLRLDRASARFVDTTTTPPYVEELPAVDATMTGLTSAASGRAQLNSSGRLAGGGSFKLGGTVATGERQRLDLTVDLRDFVLPRANPYLDRFVSWRATSGTISVTARYTVDGSQLDARHDLTLRKLEVAPSGGDDEVERRLGLPLSLLVSLMKDARGEIRLSVPVSGDLSTREFDFSEAMWAAVRNLAIRVVALPFSRVGSLFFTEDSRMVAVTIAPLVFEPGGTALDPAMPPHLDHIAGLLRDRPALRLALVPIVTVADSQALKVAAERTRLEAALGPATGMLEAARREHQRRWPDSPVPETLDAMLAALATDVALPAEALRDLSRRRLTAVTEALVHRGVDAERLTGRARRTALVEATGTGRVELDLVP